MIIRLIIRMIIRMKDILSFFFDLLGVGRKVFNIFFCLAWPVRPVRVDQFDPLLFSPLFYGPSKYVDWVNFDIFMYKFFFIIIIEEKIRLN